MIGRLALLSFLVLTADCGGGPEPRPASTSLEESEPTPGPPEARRIVRADVEPATSPTSSDVDAPLPDEACPAEVRVHLAYENTARENVPELPPILDQAVAHRSEDGRHVRIAIANHDLTLGPDGRFAALAAGQARFEAEAVRSRRGPLEPGPLGEPGARGGGLTHVRVVTPDAWLTFGHRDIGRVELTEVGPDHVCGRIDLDDGFTRVRGAFTAPVTSSFPPEGRLSPSSPER